MPRLFVAAWPDDATIARLRRLPRPDERGVRWTAPSNWHVTLRFLGDEDPDAAIELLAAADLPRSTAHVGPAVARLGDRLIVAPVDGVDALAGAVSAATDPIGERDSSPFRGHLTLARTDRRAPSALLGAAITAEFPIVAVALVRSDRGDRGSVYTTLATVQTV